MNFNTVSQVTNTSSFEEQTNQNTVSNYFNEINSDIFSEIVSYLFGFDIKNFIYVNKKFYDNWINCPDEIKARMIVEGHSVICKNYSNVDTAKLFINSMALMNIKIAKHICDKISYGYFNIGMTEIPFSKKKLTKKDAEFILELFNHKLFCRNPSEFNFLENIIKSKDYNHKISNFLIKKYLEKCDKISGDVSEYFEEEALNYPSLIKYLSKNFKKTFITEIKNSFISLYPSTIVNINESTLNIILDSFSKSKNKNMNAMDTFNIYYLLEEFSREKKKNKQKIIRSIKKVLTYEKYDIFKNYIFFPFYYIAINSKDDELYPIIKSIFAKRKNLFSKLLDTYDQYRSIKNIDFIKFIIKTITPDKFCLDINKILFNVDLRVLRYLFKEKFFAKKILSFEFINEFFVRPEQQLDPDFCIFYLKDVLNRFLPKNNTDNKILLLVRNYIYDLIHYNLGTKYAYLLSLHGILEKNIIVNNDDLNYYELSKILNDKHVSMPIDIKNKYIDRYIRKIRSGTIDHIDHIEFNKIRETIYLFVKTLGENESFSVELFLDFDYKYNPYQKNFFIIDDFLRKMKKIKINYFVGSVKNVQRITAALKSLIHEKTIEKDNYDFICNVQQWLDEEVLLFFFENTVDEGLFIYPWLLLLTSCYNMQKRLCLCIINKSMAYHTKFNNEKELVILRKAKIFIEENKFYNFIFYFASTHPKKFYREILDLVLKKDKKLYEKISRCLIKGDKKKWLELIFDENTNDEIFSLKHKKLLLREFGNYQPVIDLNSIISENKKKLHILNEKISWVKKMKHCTTEYIEKLKKYIENNNDNYIYERCLKIAIENISTVDNICSLITETNKMKFTKSKVYFFVDKYVFMIYDDSKITISKGDHKKVMNDLMKTISTFEDVISSLNFDKSEIENKIQYQMEELNNMKFLHFLTNSDKYFKYFEYVISTGEYHEAKKMLKIYKFEINVDILNLVCRYSNKKKYFVEILNLLLETVKNNDSERINEFSENILILCCQIMVNNSLDKEIKIKAFSLIEKILKTNPRLLYDIEIALFNLLLDCDIKDYSSCNENSLNIVEETIINLPHVNLSEENFVDVYVKIYLKLIASNYSLEEKKKKLKSSYDILITCIIFYEKYGDDYGADIYMKCIKPIYYFFMDNFQELKKKIPKFKKRALEQKYFYMYQMMIDYDNK